MEYVICKQERALKGKIVSTIILIFATIILIFAPEPVFLKVVVFVGALLVFGFSSSFKISKDFNNEKFFSIFGIVVIRKKLEIEFPDYISVFSGSFSLNNDWSTVSALGTKERHEKLVVRFFKENRKETLYKTKSLEKALEKAKALSELLNVEIHDATGV